MSCVRPRTKSLPPAPSGVERALFGNLVSPERVERAAQQLAQLQVELRPAGGELAPAPTGAPVDPPAEGLDWGAPSAMQDLARRLDGWPGGVRALVAAIDETNGQPGSVHHELRDVAYLVLTSLKSTGGKALNRAAHVEEFAALPDGALFRLRSRYGAALGAALPDLQQHLGFCLTDDVPINTMALAAHNPTMALAELYHAKPFTCANAAATGGGDKLVRCVGERVATERRAAALLAEDAENAVLYPTQERLERAFVLSGARASASQGLQRALDELEFIAAFRYESGVDDLTSVAYQDVRPGESLPGSEPPTPATPRIDATAALGLVDDVVVLTSEHEDRWLANPSAPTYLAPATRRALGAFWRFLAEMLRLRPNMDALRALLEMDTPWPVHPDGRRLPLVEYARMQLELDETPFQNLPRAVAQGVLTTEQAPADAIAQVRAQLTDPQATRPRRSSSTSPATSGAPRRWRTTSATWCTRRSRSSARSPSAPGRPCTCASRSRWRPSPWPTRGRGCRRASCPWSASATRTVSSTSGSPESPPTTTTPARQARGATACARSPPGRRLRHRSTPTPSPTETAPTPRRTCERISRGRTRCCPRPA